MNLQGWYGNFFKFFVCFLAINFLYAPLTYAKTEVAKVEKTRRGLIQPQERKWLEKFLTDIMLRENGIYTLWGSKPMTLIVLDHTPEEKIQAWLEEAEKKKKK